MYKSSEWVNKQGNFRLCEDYEADVLGVNMARE